VEKSAVALASALASLLCHSAFDLAFSPSPLPCGRLVYFERHGDPSTAIARETQLKTWRREKKIQLIERDNPRWQDLSAPWGKPIELYTAPTTPAPI
jgi:hypothetical protein